MNYFDSNHHYSKVENLTLGKKLLSKIHIHLATIVEMIALTKFLLMKNHFVVQGVARFICS